MASPIWWSASGLVRPSAIKIGVSPSSQSEHEWEQPRYGLTVQRKGMREASGTRLMTERACTSKNVRPRKPGVSNVRATAPRSNNAGGPGPPPWIRMASQRTSSKLEQLFPSVKHMFDKVTGELAGRWDEADGRAGGTR